MIPSLGIPEIPHNALKLGQELGRGSFGTVYQGTYRYDDVAIKQLILGKLNQDTLEEFQNESKIMWNARSPHIVQLFGTCSSSPPYCLVMELMKGGNLYDFLQRNKNKALPWSLRISLATDVAKGVLALHENRIVHRDLKSLNVLLDENTKAKLTDFGLSKIKTQTASTTKNESAGTLAWMAPELLQRKATHTQKSDMYSYGMVVWEISSCDTPFKDVSNQTLLMQLVKGGEREDIPEGTPLAVEKLIKGCWEGKGEARPDAKTAVETLLEESKRSGGLPSPIIKASPIYRGNLETHLKGSSKPSYIDNLATQVPPPSRAAPSKALPPPPAPLKVLSPQSVLSLLPNQENIFGKAQWLEHFGEIGQEPSLPAHLEKAWRSDCSFWKGKKVHETHVLTLIPVTVNGKPLTLTSLEDLIEHPKKGPATKYTYYNSVVNKQLGEVGIKSSYWLLMTKDVLEGTRNNSYEDQVKKLKSYSQGYEVPLALDSAVSILMHHVSTGKYLFGQDPLTHTRCQEVVGKYHVAVGGFAAAGLYIFHYDLVIGYIVIGVAASWK